jgi:hypothetical protein
MINLTRSFNYGKENIRVFLGWVQLSIQNCPFFPLIYLFNW